MNMQKQKCLRCGRVLQFPIEFQSGICLQCQQGQDDDKIWG